VPAFAKGERHRPELLARWVGGVGYIEDGELKESPPLHKLGGIYFLGGEECTIGRIGDWVWDWTGCGWRDTASGWEELLSDGKKDVVGGRASAAFIGGRIGRQ